MASNSTAGEGTSYYDIVRNNNMKEFREKFVEAFRDQIAEGTVRDPNRRMPSPPPRQVGRRSRRSGLRVTRKAALTRKPVRRSPRTSTSIYASAKKPERGFLGFPVSQFFRLTKYRGKEITVDWVADEDSDLPRATEDLIFTVCLSYPVAPGAIPAVCSTPEMLGNGWKDGIELESDDEVEVNVEGNVEAEDVTKDIFYKGKRFNAGRPLSARPRAPVHRCNTFPILEVEDVTPALLQGVCYGANKSRDGDCTTCHQCRQKTSDTKSICRSGRCHGLRGMFCGYCLLRRYGEDVALALLDPEWECPPCRDLCNCSICRARKNLPPTGVMYPKATEKGFTCVSDYLLDIALRED